MGKVTTHGNRINVRKKGNNFEVKVCNDLKALSFNAVTSRSNNKNLDDLGVDIMTTVPFPLNVQCKNLTKEAETVDLKPLLRIKTFHNPVLISKLSHKGRKSYGTFVTMSYETFIALCGNLIKPPLPPTNL